MDETLIKVENTSKKFCKSIKRSMAYGSIDMVRDFFGIKINRNNLRKSEFWALKDLNFVIKKGETLGIIGVNGSGKSTLLRLLTGIFPPDQGRIIINGKIGALIAVGAGFHPHLTGRENIYLNGTILGMNRKEIDDKFKQIVDFSEIGEFLDAPVSTYSSGMRVRLGFSIAVHSEPDILLVDEILSVGDLSFRNKGLRKMSQFREGAKALIFVSHDMHQIRTLCSRVIIMDKGVIVYDGPTHKGIVAYEELTRKVRLENYIGSVSMKRVTTTNEVEVKDIGITNSNEEYINEITMNEQLNIFLKFKTNEYKKELYFSISVLDDQDRACIWVINNDNDKFKFTNLEPGEYVIKLIIPEHHLIPSVYTLNYTIRDGSTSEMFEKAYTGKAFRVLSDGVTLERGVVNVKDIWNIIKIK